MTAVPPNSPRPPSPHGPGFPPPGTPFFVSWSGGKDSCLALHRAVKSGGEPKTLLTMFTEGAERSHSHGLARIVLEAQAASLGLPLVTRETSWAEYEATFDGALAELKRAGVRGGVFGDIDLDDHRAWVERVCAKAGLAAWEPLWDGVRRDLLREFIEAGFVAQVVSLKDGLLSPDLLGRRLDWDLVAEFEAAGVDASGEKGEYHTVVTGGPLFRAPLALEPRGRVLRSGYWFLDLALGGHSAEGRP